MTQSSRANLNNRANQLNPNNPAYTSSRGGAPGAGAPLCGETVPVVEPGNEQVGAGRTVQIGEGKKR